MDARIVNCFIDAARTVMKCFFAEDIKIGQLSVKEKSFPSCEVNIILGVIGQVKGQIIYGMESASALAAASKMMGGMALPKMDDLAYSAISELANMVSGNAVALMGNISVQCNITPPLIITGKNVEVHTVETKSLIIPLLTEIGQITIDIALEEAK